MGSGNSVRNVDEELYFLKMVNYTKDIGMIISIMAKEDYLLLMENFIRQNGYKVY